MGNTASKSRGTKVTNYDIQRRFLEELLKISKVNVNDSEILEMQSWVKEKLRKAVDHLKGTKLEVDDIVLCGSMAEGTRVFELGENVVDVNGVPKHVTEFDFLAVFKMPVTKQIEVEDTPFLAFDDDTCKGHMAVIDRSQGQLYPKQLREFLRENVLSHITRDADAIRLMERTGQLTLDDSIKYSFLWKPDGKRQSRSFDTLESMSILHERQHGRLINVDFMPAFLLQEPDIMPAFQLQEPDFMPATHLQNTDFMPALQLQESGFMPTFQQEPDFTTAFLLQKPDRKTPHYLVPKSLCEHNLEHFLYSNCRVEIQALLDTSQVHRDIYMLLKSFNNHLYEEYRSPSYYLKSAVLHHIEKCTEPDLVRCHRHIINFLRESCKTRRLLTYKGQINLFSYTPNKDVSKAEFLDRLKRFEQFFGAILLFVDNMEDEGNYFGMSKYIPQEWMDHHMTAIVQM